MSLNADAVENTPSKGLTLDEAFTQLKASRGQAPEPEVEEELEDEDAEVVEEDLDDEDFEADEDSDDDSDEEGDDSDSEDDDDDDAEASEEEEIFEVEIDGETVEVTGEELLKGYLRHNDYTRKRQADAKKARELETEYGEKIAQLNQALAANVSQEQTQYQALHQKYTKAEGDEKRNIHYQMLQLQQSIGQRQAALQQAKELQAQTAAAKNEAYWAEQEELLQAQYEDWGTKKVELKDYLVAQGFEDLSAFGHANMASIVDKAKQFDELQQKRNSVAKKKLKRKVPKVLKSGQGEKKFKVDSRKVKELEARFAKTGSIKDAMALKKARQGNR